MKLLYKTLVTSEGGREGRVFSDDMVLDLKISKPNPNEKTNTNPEQLFAAGYAACFNSALQFVAKKDYINITDSRVLAEVTLYDASPEIGFKLGIKLEIILPGIDHEKALDLIERADKVCPYSKAVLGNIDVIINLSRS